mgnify:CR=1 FL=1
MRLLLRQLANRNDDFVPYTEKIGAEAYFFGFFEISKPNFLALIVSSRLALR